ncbi:MAG: DUF2769 domain-containing protein [Patescibacteria group bacterium]|nr:DUF2769 domain-containing protein [Patescibacteria group bacterium]
MPGDINKDTVRCHCPSCPSYGDCMRQFSEALYCLTQKSACSVKSSGCICGGCPIYKENNLKSGYYCIQGE